jgi:hypothetical protein
MPRHIAVKLDGTGASSVLVGSKEVSLTDNGVGDYTLTFVQPFARVPVVVASSMTAGAVIQIASASVSACQIVVKDTSAAALDADLMIMIQGFDAADEY